ncbi:MAG: anaerobic ribonucleoside-triphosphate reductase activating protein [Holosporaceae bacterium]|jgi:pyruvate formate lyase activating enzyme|nr:anaerobic ribonucleoside-triphosphate reductase activating protein [Holosporaceae bacterium]
MEFLSIGGITALTTIDYPGCLSTVIFLQGCRWKCRYCHNPHLQAILPNESLPLEDIFNLLEMRKGFVEAVVFSGGEPLRQKALPEVVKKVKEMGFKVGLHTAGSEPDFFVKVLPLLDWVGFDIKYSFENYAEITGLSGSGEQARESLEHLIRASIDFEIRITMDEVLKIPVIVHALKEIADMGVKTVVLQKCRSKGDNVFEHPLFSDKLALDEVSGYFDNFSIRE